MVIWMYMTQMSTLKLLILKIVACSFETLFTFIKVTGLDETKKKYLLNKKLIVRVFLNFYEFL